MGGFEGGCQGYDFGLVSFWVRDPLNNYPMPFSLNEDSMFMLWNNLFSGNEYSMFMFWNILFLLFGYPPF